MKLTSNLLISSKYEGISCFVADFLFFIFCFDVIEEVVHGTIFVKLFG